MSAGVDEHASEVEDHHTLYRRVPDYGNADFFLQDLATGEWRPTTGSFAFDPDASVYCMEFLAERGLSWRSIVRDPQNLIYELTAGQVRSEFPMVDHTPYPDGYVDDQPHESAHCSVWPTGESLRTTKKRVRRLVKMARIVNFPDELSA